MVNWYKGKTFVFKLKDAIVKEQFTIWKGFNNRSDPDEQFQQYFPDAQVKFPIKGNMMAVQGTDGKVYNEDEVKFMKRADFLTIFPTLGKNTKYIRNILIGGLEYIYSFGKTSNDNITNMIALNAGALPTGYIKQTYFPNEAATKMYQISLVTEEVANAWEKANLGEATTATTLTAKSDSSIQKEMTVEVPKSDISEYEQNFIDQLKAMPTKLAKEQFIKAFIATSAKYGEVAKYTEKNVNVNERAEWLFENKYK